MYEPGTPDAPQSTQQQLVSALSLLEAIASSTDDLIAAEDGDFRYLYFNDAYRREFLRLWGQEIQVGTSMVQALSAWPEEQRKAMDIWSRALRGEAYAVTMEFGPSELGMQLYELRFNPIHDNAGRQIGAAHILRNVTERVRMQRALYEGEQLLRRVLDNLFAFVGLLTPDGTLVKANQTPLTAAGIRADDVIGRKFWECHWWAHSEDEQARLRAAILSANSGEVVRYDALVQMSGNSRMWIDFQIAPLRDDAGHIVYLVPSATDITARREAQAALLEADARKNEFLATLSHELRNPLAPLRNGLALLASGRDDPAAKIKTIGMMQRQVTQLVHLIDDLLDISRITSGKLALRRERLNVIEAICNAAEMTQPQLSTRKLALRLPNDPVHVTGDTQRLTQVFGNLLHNAAKFTAPNGHIHVECVVTGTDVIVTLRDDGVGIPPEKLDDVFEIFEQLDHSRDTARGGLGIGLALVQRLVALHGGSVSAHSEGPGTGSEFTVRLPLA